MFYIFSYSEKEKEMATGSNTNQVRFGPRSGATPWGSSQITHYVLRRGSASGTIVANHTLTTAIDQPVDGQPVDFAPGAIDLILNMGTGTTDAGATDVLTKYLTDYDLYMSLHTASPGANGDQGLLNATNTGYAVQEIADWTIT